WNLVRVLAREASKHAERGGDGIAAAFDRELDDVLAIEVDRVLGERCAGGVLNALIHGKDRHITRSGQAAVAVDRLHVPKHLRVAIAVRPDAIDEIRSRKMQVALVDLGLVTEKAVCFSTQI